MQTDQMLSFGTTKDVSKMDVDETTWKQTTFIPRILNNNQQLFFEDAPDMSWLYNQRGRRPSWLLSAHIRQVQEE